MYRSEQEVKEKEREENGLRTLSPETTTATVTANQQQ